MSESLPALTSTTASGIRPQVCSHADSSDPVFGVDRFNGAVTLLQPLDREVRSHYELAVRVSDAAHEAVAKLTVKVTDANDNEPVFQRPAYRTTLIRRDIADNEGELRKQIFFVLKFAIFIKISDNIFIVFIQVFQMLKK